MMRAARSAASAVLLLVPTLAASCGTTPPSRFYLLTPLAPRAPGVAAGGQAANPAPLHLETIELPKYLTGAELVTHRGGNELELAQLERWAEPLRDSIARVLASDLGALRGGTAVTRFTWERPSDPRASFLCVAIERFDVEAGEGEARVVLAARWSLAGARSAARAGEWMRPIAGDGPGAAVRAMSEALVDLARAICAEEP